MKIRPLRRLPRFLVRLRIRRRQLDLAMTLGLVMVVSLMASANEELSSAIRIIREASGDPKQNTAVREAREVLARAAPEILPQLLVAMNTDDIVTANWLRTAFDEIVEREFAGSTPRLPLQQMEQFTRDANHNGRARRLAFKVLQRSDPKIRSRLLAEWLDDPEFRREAVDELLQNADRAQQDNRKDYAIQLYHQAFQYARNADQVVAVVERLRNVGQTVDPVSHLGFVHRWWLLGPFSAPGTSGFSRSFPPEERVDVDRDVIGDEGKVLRWKLHQTNDQLGEVNLNQALAAVKESVGYAYAVIRSPREQHVRLACSADDNLTVWLNGERVLAREQWLNGTRLDRFTVPITLRDGENQVLVKICQGPQHVNPEVPNNWTFQLRLSDDTGRAAEFRNELPLVP